ISHTTPPPTSTISPPSLHDALPISIAQTLAGVPDEPPNPQIIRPLSDALYPQGHLAILKGNLSPEGAVAKITGLKNPVITGPARSEEHTSELQSLTNTVCRLLLENK